MTIPGLNQVFCLEFYKFCTVVSENPLRVGVCNPVPLFKRGFVSMLHPKLNLYVLQKYNLFYLLYLPPRRLKGKAEIYA